MFTNTNSNSILSAIRANRAEKEPLKLDRHNSAHVAYREAIQELLDSASALAASSIALHEDARRTEFYIRVSKAFRAVLSTLGEPDYKPSVNDIDAVLAFVGNFRTVDGLRSFVPAGVKTFRNSFEKFVAIRAAKEIVSNAEEIRAAKKAARKARKEAKKADSSTIVTVVPALVAPALMEAGVIETTAVELN